VYANFGNLLSHTASINVQTIADVSVQQGPRSPYVTCL